MNGSLLGAQQYIDTRDAHNTGPAIGVPGYSGNHNMHPSPAESPAPVSPFPGARFLGGAASIAKSLGGTSQAPPPYGV